jgi:PKD repeat protein
MLKKLSQSLVLLCCFLFAISCSKDDEATTVIVDFSLSVSGEAPNAIVTITNNSKGGSLCAWNFGEGVDERVVIDDAPAPLKVDKAGTFEVKMTVIGEKENKTITKTIDIPGNSAIVVYDDIAFGRIEGSAVYGRFFSIKTGLIYMDDAVKSDTDLKIDLAYSHIGTSENYFASPDDLNENYHIPGAQTTAIINSPSIDLGITSTAFDNAKDDGFIKDVTINSSDKKSFGTSNPYIILFKTSSGKKGAIKTTAINSDRLLVDIKVQKY